MNKTGNYSLFSKFKFSILPKVMNSFCTILNCSFLFIYKNSILNRIMLKDAMPKSKIYFYLVTLIKCRTIKQELKWILDTMQRITKL